MSLASQASRRYAEALLEAVHKDGPDMVQRVREELASFSGAVEETFDLKNVLSNPSFTANERYKVLEAVSAQAGYSEHIKRFLRHLIERGRMDEIRDIAATFGHLADERAGRIKAVAESASELPPQAIEQLRRALERRTGRSIDLTIRINPDLIGGVRAQVGTIVFDSTVRAELDLLRNALSITEQ